MGTLAVGATVSDLELALFAVLTGLFWWGAFLLWRDAASTVRGISAFFVIIAACVSVLPMIGAIRLIEREATRQERLRRQLASSYIIAVSPMRYGEVYYVLDDSPEGAELGPHAAHIKDVNYMDGDVSALPGVSEIWRTTDYGRGKVGMFLALWLMVMGLPLLVASIRAIIVRTRFVRNRQPVSLQQSE